MVRDTDSYFSLRMGWDFPDQEFDVALAIKEGFPTSCDFLERTPSSSTRSKRPPCCVVNIEKPKQKKFKNSDSFKRNTSIPYLEDILPSDICENINYFKERAERRDEWVRDVVAEIKSLPVCPWHGYAILTQRQLGARYVFSTTNKHYECLICRKKPFNVIRTIMSERNIFQFITHFFYS